MTGAQSKSARLQGLRGPESDTAPQSGTWDEAEAEVEAAKRWPEGEGGTHGVRESGVRESSSLEWEEERREREREEKMGVKELGGGGEREGRRRVGAMAPTVPPMLRPTLPYLQSSL